MVQFARNFVVDLANYTPASAEKGYLSAARFMSPELLSRFEPVAREQLKQVVTNRVSQFFTVDSSKVEGKDPLVVRFLGERITYVGRTETERKPYQYRLTLRYGKNSAEPIRAGGKRGRADRDPCRICVEPTSKKLTHPTGFRLGLAVSRQNEGAIRPARCCPRAAGIYVFRAKRAIPMHESTTEYQRLLPAAPRGALRSASRCFCDPT